MPTKAFNNPYGDFPSNKTRHFLSDSSDAISEKFQRKLEIFKSRKFFLLTTKMMKDTSSNRTVYTGSAGISLYYLICATTKKVNEDLLMAASEFINLNTSGERKMSFLCGDAGPIAIATVLSNKLGTKRPDNLPDYKVLLQRLLSLESLLPDSPDELLYGKAGYLYALLFVRKYLNNQETVIPSAHIKKVVTSILQSGKGLAAKTKSESPLLWKWHGKVYFGAAHGMAGILYMLLQARSFIQADELLSLVKPSIDWLVNQRYGSGNFVSSLNTSSGDRLVQWCHGAPGFVPLCILAYEVFNEDRYLDIALQCGDITWKRGLCKKGYSICHGVSGNAYTFIQLYQTTKDPIHLNRACCFMDWCVLEQRGTELHVPDRPASLFEGLVGPLYLAEDMAQIMNAKFPGFCL